jgi:predicted enzyme related to lactoylglutathione lyase
MLRIQCLTIDCHNPKLVAEFWRDVLNWRITHISETEVVLEPPAGSPLVDVAPDLLFLKVSDEKVVKNRLHLDLRPDDKDAEVARLKALGAVEVEIGQSADPDTTWVVLADPEGNEFCVLKPLADQSTTAFFN